MSSTISISRSSSCVCVCVLEDTVPQGQQCPETANSRLANPAFRKNAVPHGSHE